jgi:chemotaxis protein methyltransferase CheR
MEADTYQQIKLRVKQILNIDLGYYKDEQMKRRLDSWLSRTASASWADYFQVIVKSPDELHRFRNYLTINVTEFFRDPDRWQMLRNAVVPRLLDEQARSGSVKGLHVWSAGCSIGVEAYSLAILLDETGRGKAHSILATDLDRGALQKCRERGPYRLEEIKNLTSEQRLRYLEQRSGCFYARENLARSIRFEEQDLNADRFTAGFDLILCRNVIIYFTNEAKLNLYRKFYEALRPGGVLFLGGTEIIPSPKDLGFANQGYSFYRKES